MNAEKLTESVVTFPASLLVYSVLSTLLLTVGILDHTAVNWVALYPGFTKSVGRVYFLDPSAVDSLPKT